MALGPERSSFAIPVSNLVWGLKDSTLWEVCHIRNVHERDFHVRDFHIKASRVKAFRVKALPAMVELEVVHGS